ncbi:acyclic terpene utilization AtuA family protein [Brevibacterium siliguriense]|uniref:acyclic terpene utilization AtuA family protein n=1 Tax=Brevibacterium siliguriense TaxID=1136497 RepID=UPI001E323BE8|nr:acyclic terpene utilization AtuA family protein [Brevibacterium siliguriense]
MKAHDLGSEAREADPPKPGTVRIGSGAGFAGDRLDPALELAQLGHLDFLVFELLGERTVANAHRARLNDPSVGYDPTLLERIRLTAPHCSTNGTRIITNGGAANPLEAGRAVTAMLDDLGIDMSVAVVTGDDVLDQVHATNPHTWEDSLPADSGEARLVSANAYLGAAGIRKALDEGADIVITGRVADPSLYVGPLSHSFSWPNDDSDLIGQATVIGHLLECGGQVTGGYFADPETKPVAGLDRLGFPYADVGDNGDAIIGKLQGTGGVVTVRTCTEQLLYEVADPSAYITPDVVADFTATVLREVEPDRIEVSGGKGTGAPADLKVTLGYLGGWEADGQITYAGPRALERAQLAADIVVRRLERIHGFRESELSVEFIGAGASLRGLSEVVGPPEVRLRVAGVAESRSRASAIGSEVEALYTNGPAGGGGARTSIRESLSIKSCSLPRALTEAAVVHTSELTDHEEANSDREV